MNYQVIFTDELYHHGVKGQKWGVRRYQNLDGSYKSRGSKVSKNNEKTKYEKPKKKMSTKKKVAIGFGIAGAALAAYGVYKYGKFIKDQARKNIIEQGEHKATEYEGKSWAAQMKLLQLRKFKQGDELYKLDREFALHDAKWNRKIAEGVRSDYKRKADKTAKSFRESYKFIKDAKRNGTYIRYR